MLSVSLRRGPEESVTRVLQDDGGETRPCCGALCCVGGEVEVENGGEDGMESSRMESGETLQ